MDMQPTTVGLRKSSILVSVCLWWPTVDDLPYGACPWWLIVVVTNDVARTESSAADVAMRMRLSNRDASYACRATR